MYGAFDVVLYSVIIQLFWLLINLLLILSYLICMTWVLCSARKWSADTDRAVPVWTYNMVTLTGFRHPVMLLLKFNACSVSVRALILPTLDIHIMLLNMIVKV